jgi:hypothetical protein
MVQTIHGSARPRRWVFLALLTLGSLLCLASLALAAGGGGGNVGVTLVPLSTLPIPEPAASDIIDHAAAIRLGKAFFWDIQVGGDG